MEQLGVHLGDEGLELVDRVEDLDALRVRVEAHLERPRHRRHPAAELLLGVLEALRHVVDRLVLLVLVRLHGRGGRLERAQLGLVAEGVQQLAVRRKQTGAVRLHVRASGFFAQTELDGEPVDLREKENRRFSICGPNNKSIALIRRIYVIGALQSPLVRLHYSVILI